MPNVDEWCDSESQLAPEVGGLGDNEGFEAGYEGANYGGDGLEVMKGEVIEGSSQETRGDDHLEYHHEA